jgi:hypothetical protein
LILCYRMTEIFKIPFVRVAWRLLHSLHGLAIFTRVKPNDVYFTGFVIVRRVWRYQRGNQNRRTDNTMGKEKWTNRDWQKNKQKTKDRVPRI